MTEPSDATSRGRRVSRRAQRPAAEGVDPRPSEHRLTARAAEDRPEGWGEKPAPGGSDRGNDDRLKRDRPPHWG
ncbi:hypothetical protein JD292_00240 [Leucobacter sp. CSA2]|uniref:Uncharacterized protein n=1 Tax=Leucobacter edaphi TaxID=2796472 RepID=A0A934UW22_9MICO|nr:hypothetical protein [Leucobacter edaphi]MBK0420515.1 hypothetical protein [Leucobacter edaphi]